MRIGIYGGTFDPPHIGHLNAAEAARDQLGIDRLILIPAGIPPHKRLQMSSASGEDRLEMVKLAAEHLKGAEVSDTEIKRTGKSFTSDTVRQIKQSAPNDDIYLFIGTDMLMIFEEWHEFQSIFDMCTLAVFAREDDDREKIHEKAAQLREKYKGYLVHHLTHLLRCYLGIDLCGGNVLMSEIGLDVYKRQVGIYPLLIIGGEFWNHIGSGLSDVAHVFGSPPVVSLTRCDIAGLDRCV